MNFFTTWSLFQQLMVLVVVAGVSFWLGYALGHQQGIEESYEGKKQ